MNVALLILGGIFIVATLLPLIRQDHWAIRDFDFPHVQLTTINVILLLVFFALSTGRWVGKHHLRRIASGLYHLPVLYHLSVYLHCSGPGKE